MCEVFAGCARMSAAVADTSLRVTVPIDHAYGPAFDLLGSMFGTVCRWITSGQVWLLILAVPITDDSVASNPNDRSPGRQLHRRKLLLRVYRLIALCKTHWVRLILENPRFSGF